MLTVALTEAPNHLHATENAPNLFGADEALMREIRSLEDQLAEMPRSLCVSREGAWPWRHEGHYCTSAAGALDSLAVTAALLERLYLNVLERALLGRSTRSCASRGAAPTAGGTYIRNNLGPPAVGAPPQTP